MRFDQSDPFGHDCCGAAAASPSCPCCRAWSHATAGASSPAQRRPCCRGRRCCLPPQREQPGDRPRDEQPRPEHSKYPGDHGLHDNSHPRDHRPGHLRPADRRAARPCGRRPGAEQEGVQPRGPRACHAGRLAGGGGAADGAIGAGHLSRQVPGRPSEAEVGSVDVRWSRCDLQQPVVRGGTGGWRPAIVEAVEVRGQVRASDRRVGDRYDHCT